MAVEITVSTTVTGTSKINGQLVANFYASIPVGGGESSSVSRSIVSQELYDANRKEVRADEADFRDKVYEIEDKMLAN